MQVARAESNQTATDNPLIDDKDLLQADATIMAGILILLAVSSIKDETRLSLYSFLGLFPFAFSAAVLIIRGWLQPELSNSESSILIVLSRISAIVGLIILATILAIIVKFTKYLEETEKFRSELSKHKAALQSTADFLNKVTNHLVQSKADIATLAKITYDMMPDRAQSVENAQNVRLDALDQKIGQAQAELSKLPPILYDI